MDRKHVLSQAAATDEAVLLLFRKLQRLHPGALNDVWERLPDGARVAIMAAESRADVVRDRWTPAKLAWPEVDLDEGTDEDE